MPTLTIKFDNEYEFKIDRILRNTGKPKIITPSQGEEVDTITITAPLIPKEDMLKQITPSNMKHFVVYRNGEILTEYTGYSDITSISETIDRGQQIFTIEAQHSEK